MKNKYILAVALVAIMVLSVAFLPGVIATPNDDKAGHDGPKGKHLYQLNLIGVDSDNHLKNDDNKVDPNNGRTIFVKLGKKGGVSKQSNIYLKEGEFDVLDRDATDPDGALFQLPAPEEGTAYSVWLRSLGNPNGMGSMGTCAWDYSVSPPVEYCQTPVTLDPSTGHGKRKFTDVTRELTTVEYDGHDIDIFSPPLEDYYWKVLNNGVKRVQIRFYPAVVT